MRGRRRSGRALALHHRPRHARVGRLDRARARPRRARGRGGDHDRRRHPDAGHRLHHARAGLRRRARHQRLAQSVRGQRHQGLLGPRREVHRDARARTSRRSSPTRSWQVPRRRPAAGRSHRRHRRLHRAYARWRFPTRSGSAASASRSTRPTARRRRSRRGCSGELGFDVAVIGDEPDGRNINLDCGSTHPEQPRRARQAGRPPPGRGLRRRRRSRDLHRSRRARRRRRRRDAVVRAAT